MFPAVVMAALPHLDIMEKRELYGYVLNGVPASVVLLCMWGFAFRRALAFQESWWQVRMHSCVCSFQTLVIHDRSQGAHRAIRCFGIFCWCACNRICFLKAWTPQHGIRHSTRSFSWFEPMCWSHDGPHQCSSFAVWESIAHFAVVCTSFCWINSATHGRSMSFPLGDVQRQYVQEGTALAFSTVTCMTYIHVTCVFATNTLCIVRSQGCSLLDCVATWMCPHSGAASQQPPCLSSSSSMVDPVAFQYASQPQIWPLGCHKFGWFEHVRTCFPFPIP